MLNLIKRSLLMVALFICTILLLCTIWGKKRVPTPALSQTGVASPVTTDDPMIQYFDDDLIEVSRIDTPVIMDSESYDEMLAYIDAMKTEYPYSELFGLEAANESCASYSVPTVHSGDIRDQNGAFPLDLFVAAVMKNSAQYYEQLGPGNAFYEIMSEEDVREICELILQYIEKANKVVTLDTDRLSCCLADLKMLYRRDRSQWPP